MISRSQHRLRCLIALGYPLPWISRQTGLSGPTLTKHHRTGADIPDDAFDAIYAMSGEQRATPENTGLPTSDLGRTRARAARYGYLPPMAYEQDEDGNDILADPDSAAGVIGAWGRTHERMAQDRLDLLKSIMLVPDRTIDELAASIGITNWEREITPFKGKHMRHADRDLLTNRRGWINKEFNRALLDLIAGAEIGECPMETWDRCLALFAAQYGPVEATQSNHAQAA